MKNVLKDIKSVYNKVLDIIAFDLCWLGTIETAYELVPYADYFAASPEEEPNPGWNYFPPINFLANNPDISPLELTIRITNDFKDTYKSGKHNEWKYMTYAAVDLNRFEEHFIPLLNNFADTMAQNIYDNYNLIKNARKNTAKPHRKSYMRDLFHFAELIEADQSASDELRAAAGEINKEYNNTILKFVHGIWQPDALGLSIYFPDYGFKDEYLKRISFSNERWDEFLELFLTPIQIEHLPLNDTEVEVGQVEVKALIKGFDLDEDNFYVFYQDEKSDMKIPVQMLPTDKESEFSAKINLQNFDTNVYYYLRAQENTVSSAYIWSPQGTNEGDISTWYSFYCGIDNETPIIDHVQSMDIDGILGEPYTFFVNISDNLGLEPESLLFNFNTDNGGNYTSVPLSLDTYPNRYKCTLPKQSAGTIIYYYFSASDMAKGKNSARSPDPENFEFNVSRVRPKASFVMYPDKALTFEQIEFTSTSVPEELLVSYSWDFGDGTPLLGGKIVTHEYTKSDVYTITLRVTDENGLWSEAQKKIIIENSPPIAVIKKDPILVNSEDRFVDDDNYIIGIIYEDDIITLDCTGSIDKDGYIRTWTWQLGDGNKYSEICTDWNGDGRFDFDKDRVVPQTEMSPSEQNLTLNTTKRGQITYLFTHEGNYTIRFSAIDNEETVSIVQILRVVVKNKLPVPRPGYTKIDGLSVMFTANATDSGAIDTQSDIDLLNYTWNFGEGSISYEQNPNHIFPEREKYEITLTVIDDDGGLVVESFELDLSEKEEQSDFFNLFIFGIGLISLIILLIIVFLIMRYRNKTEQPDEGIESDKERGKAKLTADYDQRLGRKKPPPSITGKGDRPFGIKDRSKPGIGKKTQRPFSVQSGDENDGAIKVSDLMGKIQR
jgi:PKD repeat protein